MGSAIPLRERLIKEHFLTLFFLQLSLQKEYLFPKPLLGVLKA
jgi:hypothetical protein